MKELQKYLAKSFIDSNAKRWQDVKVPIAFVDKAKEIGLSQEETFNFAINTWNKYVTGQLAPNNSQHR